MTKWVLQTEEITQKTNEGLETIKISLDIQKDEKGNILQKGGGVIPVACQNCGKNFETNSVEDELRQELNSYKCNNCDFNSMASDDALKHFILEKEHEMTIVQDSRVVGVRTTLEGVIPIVTKTENDVFVLCRDCHDNN